MGIPQITDFAAEIKQTRDEIIAVKFYGGIKNVGEAMYKAITHMGNFKQYWLEDYPGLNVLEQAKSDEERFYLAATVTGPEFLRIVLRKDNTGGKVKERSVMIGDYAKIRSRLNPYELQVTNMELMLRTLAEKEFCKKIYVFEEKFGLNDQLYLAQLFESVGEKVVVFEQGFDEMLKSHPEITTVFTDSTTEVVNYIQSFPEGDPAVKGKCFMVGVGPALDRIGNSQNPDDIFKFQPFFKEVPERYGAMVRWWQIKALTYYDKLIKPGGSENGNKSN